ncbi:MAG TPA: hypothetical protein VES89_13945 [Candidatus Competibacteraceae bacterium]|nr:hypothetical protein [Candidatus Competibacteraceae bacterium]
MHPMTYHIPADLLADYHGQPTIVRARNPTGLWTSSVDLDLETLAYIQLPLSPATIDELAQWREPVPLDLVLSEPDQHYPLLYRCSLLLDHCPVRISIPVTPGFSKAVKLAVSLQFAVKLEITPPQPDLIEELIQVLTLYLHRSTVAQPIEPFHSSLLAFFHQQPVTLWAIQEEDPTLFRYITDQGEERLPGRLTSIPAQAGSGAFVERWRRQLLAENSECNRCSFLDYCGGYFKWPERTFRCDGVKMLFGSLQEAATELRQDLAAFSSAQ